MVPAGKTVNEEQSVIPFGTPASEGTPVVYGPHIVDALIAKGVNVTAIFSPEHGFRGSADAGENVSSSVDEKTGVPILSLYEHGTHLPSAEAMSAFDVIVVDIQDVGLRYYTYYITMHHLMEAGSLYGKEMIVLDRPNPNGFYVDGPLLDMKYKSSIGWLPVAMVHGMTLGEIALMVNGEGWLPEGRTCNLTVIPCRNYTHSTKYTLLMAPSPNLKDMKSIYLYSSTCFFTATQALEGRGTEFPFEVYGHPAMKNRDFSFIPRSIPGAKAPRHQDEVCYGVDLRSVPLDSIWAQQVNLEYLLDAYNDLAMGDDFFGADNLHFEHQIGQGYVRSMIESGSTADVIEAMWSGDVEAFKVQRKPYLLYPEQ
ncbi:MAG: DUF1343 domain-containing protein [Bacteroidales bacterium]|nr:DUF1343 domain-containing protein [Candidatus Cacconaster merdequi]